MFVCRSGWGSGGLGAGGGAPGAGHGPEGDATLFGYFLRHVRLRGAGGGRRGGPGVCVQVVRRHQPLRDGDRGRARHVQANHGQAAADEDPLVIYWRFDSTLAFVWTIIAFRSFVEHLSLLDDPPRSSHPRHRRVPELSCLLLL
eukprot:1185303-Prorocentrum_minimum.AAC.2